MSFIHSDKVPAALGPRKVRPALAWTVFRSPLGVLAQCYSLKYFQAVYMKWKYEIRKILNVHLRNRVEKQFWLFTFVRGPIWLSGSTILDPVSTVWGCSAMSRADSSVSWALFLGQVNYAAVLELLTLLNVLLCLLAPHNTQVPFLILTFYGINNSNRLRLSRDCTTWNNKH